MKRCSSCRRRCVSNNNRRYYTTNRAARLVYGRRYRAARNTGA